MSDQDVGRRVSLRSEQRSQFFDDRPRISRGRRWTAGAVARARVGEDPRMARDLASDLVPVSPVIAEAGLEDDGRGATFAGRRDLDLVAAHYLDPGRDSAAAGRDENGDGEE